MTVMVRRGEEEEEEEEKQAVSVVALLIAGLRKSMVAACRGHGDGDGDGEDEEGWWWSMTSSSSSSSSSSAVEIGWPTNVEHLTHVTFDPFHGFLGLPLEFQVQIPSRVPSASVSVFGVSADSMHCSYDSRGNRVPTILLQMQETLYAQGGLNAEGIFRINAENTKEEEVREQLNRGTVPQDIDVHCLAGLIKAWFRELPRGVLDGLSPQQVLHSNTDEHDSARLLKQLNPTETALLNWAVDLMSDVVQHQHSNKMNARNIAMVFAPNMTQMSDPLTALMHAVQVMNLLKTLITKTLRERQQVTDGGSYSPISYRSSEEEIETSCELSRQPEEDEDQDEDENEDEDEDENADEQGDEVESLSEIEESFFQQLIENENAKDCFKKELGNLVKQRSSPTSGFDFQEESSVMTDGYMSGMSVSPGVETLVQCVK